MISPSILKHVDTLVEAQLEGGEGYFARLLSQAGVHRASYIAVNLPKVSERHYFLNTTFPDSWAQHYAAQGYLAVDPAMQRAFTSLLPFDWAEFKTLTPRQSKLFGEAREFGVGEHGLSIPLRSSGGEIAVMSVTADMSQRNWQQFKREKLGEVRLLASLFSVDVMKALRGTGVPAEVVLTMREVECLRWCAEGKTFEEIAGILGISPRTVRYHLDSARRKLDCLNIVQTVVTALQRRLI